MKIKNKKTKISMDISKERKSLFVRNDFREINLNSGITLIALVITIIVLIILAAITLNMLSGENGILNRAGESSELQKDAEENEQVQLAVMTAMSSDSLGKITDENLRKAISEYFGSDSGLSGTDSGPWTYTGKRNVYTINGNGEVSQIGNLTEDEKNQIVDVVAQLVLEQRVFVLTRGGEVYEAVSENGNIFSKYKVAGDPITSNGVKVKNSWDMFIDESGKVYGVGYNTYGQLGDGTTEDKNNVTCISDVLGSPLNGKVIVDMDSGAIEYKIAIDEDGKLYAWGKNESGQLGDGSTESRSMPICISDIFESPLEGKKIEKVESFYSNGNRSYAVFAIDEDGKLYTWGDNEYGQLGDGTKENRSTPKCISDITGSELNGKKIIDLDYDSDCLIATDEDGKLYTWGNGQYGQLGNGTTEIATLPVCISDILGSVLNGKIIKGIYNYNFEKSIIALDENGLLYGWGNDYYGLFGGNTSTPVCINEVDGSILKDKKIVKIDDDWFTRIVAVDDNDKIYVLNSSSKVCVNDTEDDILYGKKIVNITNLGERVFFLDDNGLLYGMGRNKDGEIGDGTQENKDMPVCISNVSGSILNGKKIVDIYTTGANNGVIWVKDDNGKIYAWGTNQGGLIGDGTEERKYMPICINDVTGSALYNKKIQRRIEVLYFKGYITEDGDCYFENYSID